jgi:hypothetical protein
MAKGQRRSNREAKKPKKEKPAVAPASGAAAPWSTIERIKSQDRAKK